MTKNFCDLCGEPAAANWPTLRVSFPEMKWSGSKTSAVSVVDGTWTPYVESRIVFDAHDMPRSVSAHNPDLCKQCIADLLRKMADSLTVTSK